jgi:AcrR family transcriptional regulator
VSTPDETDESREPRTRARAARRQALLETAESVFAERGFTGATMAEIAARAGYSAGNLYNVFEGKDALFAEVLRTRADQVLELVRNALRSGESLAAIVDRYVDATLELVEVHRGFFVLLMQSTPDFEWHGSQSDPEEVDLRRQLDLQLEQVFLDAMSRGEIPSGDPRPYMCLLHGTVNAHVARWVRSNGNREDLRGSADDLRRLLRRGLGVGNARD